MPLSSEDWVKALSHISEAEQLKVTVKGSFFGSVFVGGFCMVLSLLLGPEVGLLIGGIVGGCISFFKFRGTYKPVSSVLKELTPEQREALFKDLQEIRSKVTAVDYIELIMLLQGGGGLVLKKKVLDVVVGYLKQKLKLTIT
eukprot:TCONS_00007344-protein